MQHRGRTLPAFLIETHPPLPRADDASDRIERIRQHSRATYARPTAAVDAEIISRFRSDLSVNSQSTAGDRAINEVSFFD